MKVFYAISDACRVLGGAERAASVLLRRLQDHYGFQCEMLSCHPVPYEEVRDGIRLRGFADLEELTSIALAEKPDIVIGSLGDAVMAFQMASRFDIPRILSVHGYEFSPPNEDERREWSMHPGFTPLNQKDIDFVLSSANHIYSCSAYLQNFLRDRAGVESDVLGNDWDNASVLIEKAKRGDTPVITAVCASAHKGIEIFLELARRFPDEPFQLAGTPGSDFPPKLVEDAIACKNIELPGHSQPREFLSPSKLVLIPSQWPEPFGRLAV